jgi:glutaredoxin
MAGLDDGNDSTQSRALASRHEITLITRVDCHLCQDAEALLRAMAQELGFGLVLLDVDSDRDRANEYSDRVPVILLNGREHGYWRVEEERLRAALSA